MEAAPVRARARRLTPAALIRSLRGCARVGDWAWNASDRPSIRRDRGAMAAAVENPLVFIPLGGREAHGRSLR